MNLALFDLDGTLLPGDSDHAFGELMLALGWADAGDFRRRNDEFYAQYQSGRLDIHAYVDFATEPWREREPEVLAQASQRFLDEWVRPMIRREALALIQHHREQGDRLAIVTATNAFVTRPIATLLGVDDLIATELAVDGAGRASGVIHGEPCFGAGKVGRVEQWLAASDLRLDDFGRSTFYSDSTNDLPLLERVSHPVATNPSLALERVALQRGWPVLRLFA